MPETETPVISLQINQHRRFLIACVAVALGLRLTLSLISQGSNDAATWERFGHRVAEVGLLRAYQVEPDMNHPPLPLLWARLSILTGERGDFAFAMKLPAILSDAVACVLIVLIWLRHGDARRAKLAGWAMALNPVAILVSGYHCNTDSVLAMLALLAMYLIDLRKSFILIGLAVGASINIKLIPILLIPLALSFCRNRSDILKLITGLAITAIPFVPLLTMPNVLERNLLKYAPPLCEWGVPFFFKASLTYPPLEYTAQLFLERYLWIGRWAIIAVAVTLGIDSYLHRRWNPYQLAVLVFASMLVLAPGFGVQYLVIVVPVLMAVSITRSWMYSVLGGLFLATVYITFLQKGIWPLYSSFYDPFPMPGPLFGLLAWWILAETIVHQLQHPIRRGDSSKDSV